MPPSCSGWRSETPTYALLASGSFSPKGAACLPAAIDPKLPFAEDARIWATANH
jgi:hypothetical protein